MLSRCLSAPAPALVTRATKERRTEQEKMNTSSSKAIVKNADMSDEMQQDAVECCTQAMGKYNIEKDIAAYVKKEFDKKHYPNWHCIVGRNFGSYVTHESKHFIYFYMGQFAILLFKSAIGKREMSRFNQLEDILELFHTLTATTGPNKVMVQLPAIWGDKSTKSAFEPTHLGPNVCRTIKTGFDLTSVAAKEQIPDQETMNNSNSKAIVKNADMSDEMQQDAVECSTQAMEKFNIEKDIAAYIKKEFDRKYSPTWHCIVGRNFGSYVTHESKHFIYFYMGQVAVLLFKSG
ncbi:unnamed protein product [Schistocephalus solidus]|uniref:Nop domain-containing protein n=1 Tax=Schistocephalus solidus TaxID=70667 RepID=A0A183SDG0_SCHSO|nr:unnamed protein product [Schistocephalus solidus]